MSTNALRIDKSALSFGAPIRETRVVRLMEVEMLSLGIDVLQCSNWLRFAITSADSCIDIYDNFCLYPGRETGIQPLQLLSISL